MRIVTVLFLLLSQPVLAQSAAPVVRFLEDAELRDLIMWYVIDGSAILVTGGTMVDAANTAPGEVRGDGIEGVISRRVQKGDFAVVPADTPHWISAVDGDEILQSSRQERGRTCD